MIMIIVCGLLLGAGVYLVNDCHADISIGSFDMEAEALGFVLIFFTVFIGLATSIRFLALIS